MDTSPRFSPLATLARAAGALLLATASHGAAAALDCGPAEHDDRERCAVGLQARDMGRMHQMQQASNWCWAASISMLLGHYGVAVPQRDLVLLQLGTLENVPLAGEALLGLVNRSWPAPADHTLVARVRPQPSWRLPLGVLAPEVLDELVHERPVLLGAASHAMLLVQVVFERPRTGARGGVTLVAAVVLDSASTPGLRRLRRSEHTPTLLALVQTQVSRNAATP